MESNAEKTKDRLDRLNKTESKTRLISVKVSPSIEREIMSLSEQMRSGKNHKTHSDFLRHLLLSGMWSCYEKLNYSNAKAADRYADNILENKNYDEILQLKLETFQRQIIDNQNKMILELNEKLEILINAQKSKKWFR